MSTNWAVLGQHRGTHFRAAYEARSAHLTGPAGACHPHELELCFLEHGREQARLGGKAITVCEGQYSLVSPGVEHSSWTNERPAVEWIVHFSTDLLKETAAELGSGCRTPADWPREPFAAPPEMVAVLAALRQELTSPPSPARELMVGSLRTYLCTLLLKRHAGTASGISPVAAAGAGARLGRAEELLRTSFAEPLTVEQLAATAGMSRYHFLRAFKKHFGSSPYAYLTGLRVERATELIRNTDMPLTRIAFDVGFGSSGRLSEAFKRRHGQSPSKWRKRRRHQGGNFRTALPHQSARTRVATMISVG